MIAQAVTGRTQVSDCVKAAYRRETDLWSVRHAVLDRCRRREGGRDRSPTVVVNLLIFLGRGLVVDIPVLLLDVDDVVLVDRRLVMLVVLLGEVNCPNVVLPTLVRIIDFERLPFGIVVGVTAVDGGEFNVLDVRCLSARTHTQRTSFAYSSEAGGSPELHTAARTVVMTA